MQSEQELKKRMDEIYTQIEKRREEAQKILADMTNLCKDAIAIQIQLKQIDGNRQGTGS